MAAAISQQINNYDAVLNQSIQDIREYYQGRYIILELSIDLLNIPLSRTGIHSESSVNLSIQDIADKFGHFFEALKVQARKYALATFI